MSDLLENLGELGEILKNNATPFIRRTPLGAVKNYIDQFDATEGQIKLRLDNYRKGKEKTQRKIDQVEKEIQIAKELRKKGPMTPQQHKELEKLEKRLDGFKGDLKRDEGKVEKEEERRKNNSAQKKPQDHMQPNLAGLFPHHEQAQAEAIKRGLSLLQKPPSEKPSKPNQELVRVRAHERSGPDVSAHNRTRPDDDLSNNLSYKKS